MAVAERAPSMEAVPARIAPDRNGLAREQVAEIQRSRILTAMIAVAAERGWSNVTVTHVVSRSGTSRRTFYELFEDREECYVAAFEAATKRVEGVVMPVYRTRGKWQARARSALTALLELFDEEPRLARFLVVDSLGAGPVVLEHRRAVLAHIIDEIDRQAGERRGQPEPTGLTAEGVVGAVLSVIHARVLDPGEGSLVDLLNPLMGMVVLPYQGRAAARKELGHATPSRSNPVRDATSNPLHDLGMRLTYRTIRVLVAVARAPGSSNREVGQAAGMVDQGQISKLLMRLERLGLIRNDCATPARGAPNAWTLTDKGKAAERAMSANIAHEDGRSV